MQLSQNGARFVGTHEGLVFSAYQDSGGVWTIGYGFTMLSATFSEYWLKTRGHKLRKGDRITAEECQKLLPALFDEEYGPPVTKKFGDIPQHQFDASASAVYNAGPGTLKDRWAAALARRAVSEAATLLRATRVTARGKRLKGLVRRRDEEARLLQFGDYGFSAGGVKVVIPVRAEVMDWQRQLTTLGYYTGRIDGQAGDLTSGAFKNFQRKEGLDATGEADAATRAALNRAIDARRATQGGGTVTATAGGADAVTNVETVEPPADVPIVPDAPIPQPDAPPIDAIPVDGMVGAIETMVIVGIICFALYLVWRYRGRILRRRTPT